MKSSRPKTVLVETYRPTQTPTGRAAPIRHHVRVHASGNDTPMDALHPSLSSLWKVHHVRTHNEALALVIEVAAGLSHHTNVELLIGHAATINSLPREE